MPNFICTTCGTQYAESDQPPAACTICKDELKTKFPLRPWRITRIKNIRSYQDDYFPFIEECRRLAKEEQCLPIEVEFYWRWVEAEGHDE